MAVERVPIKSLTLDGLGEHLKDLGQPSYRAGQVLQWIYGRRVGAFSEMSDLPATLRAQLAEEFVFDEMKVVRTLGSKDPT